MFREVFEGSIDRDIAHRLSSHDVISSTVGEWIAHSLSSVTSISYTSCIVHLHRANKPQQVISLISNNSTAESKAVDRALQTKAKQSW